MASEGFSEMRQIGQVIDIGEKRAERQRGVMREFHRVFLEISALSHGQVLREAGKTNPELEDVAIDLDDAIQNLLDLGLKKAGISSQEWTDFISAEYQPERE